MFGFGVPTITTDQLAERMKRGKPVVLDVREPYEYAEGHVPGARNVPLATLVGVAPSLDSTAETLVICRSGHRSATAVRRLRKLGFTNVYSVKGGTLAWRGKLKR